MTNSGVVSPGRGKRRAGMIMMVIGGIFIIAAIVIGIISTVAAGRGLADIADSAEQINGQTTVTLEEGNTRTLLGTSDAVSCTVTDPNGNNIALAEPIDIDNTTETEQGVSVGALAQFDATVDGDYTITCTGGQAYLAPELSGGLFAGLLGIAGSLTAGFIGFVLGLIGLIVWIVGRGQDSRAASSGGYGGGSSFGAGGSYGGDSGSYGGGTPPPPGGYGGQQGAPYQQGGSQQRYSAPPPPHESGQSNQNYGQGYGGNSGNTPPPPPPSNQ